MKTSEADRTADERPSARETAADPNLIDVSNLTRRKFLGVVGTSAALASTTAGCVRKPKENIVPYAKRPEELIPGKPRAYATAAAIGQTVLGLLVESHDGRPTKIEGNPRHPMSMGATNAWAQAEVMCLYDPDRSRHPTKGGKRASWDDFWTESVPRFQSHAERRGQGLALMVEDISSPTYRLLLGDMLRTYPETMVCVYGASHGRNGAMAQAMLGLAPSRLLHSLDKADVIVALDYDFLGIEGDVVCNNRQFASRRGGSAADDRMNRLYVVEPGLTLTGGMADNRLPLAASRIGDFVEALASAVFKMGLAVPEGASEIVARLPHEYDARFAKWVDVIARDLLQARGRAALMVGESQSAATQALVLFINHALGNTGAVVHVMQDVEAMPRSVSVLDLAHAMGAERVQTLLILGNNPAYDTPADLEFAKLVARVPVSIHLSMHVDETSRLVTWHLPKSHFLESWGDLRATDGTVAIQQPLIAPLFESQSAIEVLAHLVPDRPKSGYDILRSTWSHRFADKVDFDTRWRRWLSQGIVEDSPRVVETPLLTVSWKPIAEAMVAARSAAVEPTGPGDLEVLFPWDASVFDGRYANIGWLQEMPDPISKLTWDNAVYVNPKTGAALQVKQGDVVQLWVRGRSLEAAVYPIPGIAENVLVLPRGYGRDSGSLARGAGFNAYALMHYAAPYFDRGVKVVRLNRAYRLAITQGHQTQDDRPIARQGSLETFRRDPDFAKKMVESEPIRSLWQEPLERGGQQWGMSIDLNKCTGCSACVVACQAENNIPVVGKKHVEESREMHWIRIDRYFAGTNDQPTMVTQPMACVQCENAPCESVCPVAATAHSPEGLNDQAYQRCIGTRYCSNNCPYKVRRFNFFQYNKDLDPLVRMQKNPDVTLRFRGVMEKCTYCVQRINEGKIQAKVHSDGVVRDGNVKTACQQVCPADAIVFGDINDKASAVSVRKANPRDYGVLAELNTKPRTTYLAKLRNPNPELV